MPILDSQIKIKHSGAAAANQGQTNGDLSLGGYIASSDVGVSLHVPLLFQDNRRLNHGTCRFAV